MSTDNQAWATYDDVDRLFARLLDPRPSTWPGPVALLGMLSKYADSPRRLRAMWKAPRLYKALVDRAERNAYGLLVMGADSPADAVLAREVLAEVEAFRARENAERAA